MRSRLQTFEVITTAIVGYDIAAVFQVDANTGDAIGVIGDIVIATAGDHPPEHRAPGTE